MTGYVTYSNFALIAINLLFIVLNVNYLNNLPVVQQQLDVKRSEHLELAAGEVAKLSATNLALMNVFQMKNLADEVRKRLESNSGITETRSYGTGTQTYHQSMHQSDSGAMSMHDHANYETTIGLGKFGAVLNGVEFYTRHNDYTLQQPADAAGSFDKTIPIPFPDVPLSVLNKSTVQLQIKEMQEYFFAFQTQNVSHRDYRPYFKPVLTYLEGGWMLDHDVLSDRATSERNSIDSSSFSQLLKKNRFNFASGRDHINENLPFLPRALHDYPANKPRFYNFEYKVLSQPLPADVPTSWFRVKDDSATQMGEIPPLNSFELAEHRKAVFEVSSSRHYYDMIGNYDTLDSLMEKVPGRNNAGILGDYDYLCQLCHHNEPNTVILGYPYYIGPIGGRPYLNTVYYSRHYGVLMPGLDAMLRPRRQRGGFHDASLWCAMTSNVEVLDVPAAPDGVHFVAPRHTYAVPLEIVYLTPLSKWNPYKLTIGRTPAELANTINGRNGDDKPYNGAHAKGFFYLTPAEFFDASDVNVEDPADTNGGVVNVLDQNGATRKVRASGHYIQFPKIPGVPGRVRQRYPISPLASYKDNGIKEERALKHMHASRQLELSITKRLGLNMFTLFTDYTQSHYHTITINATIAKVLLAGQVVTVTSEAEQGHVHEFKLQFVKDQFIVLTCDGRNATCADGHKIICQKLRDCLDLSFVVGAIKTPTTAYPTRRPSASPPTSSPTKAPIFVPQAPTVAPTLLVTDNVGHFHEVVLTGVNIATLNSTGRVVVRANVGGEPGHVHTFEISRVVDKTQPSGFKYNIEDCDGNQHICFDGHHRLCDSVEICEKEEKTTQQPPPTKPPTSTPTEAPVQSKPTAAPPTNPPTKRPPTTKPPPTPDFPVEYFYTTRNNRYYYYKTGVESSWETFLPNPSNWSSKVYHDSALLVSYVVLKSPSTDKSDLIYGVSLKDGKKIWESKPGYATSHFMGVGFGHLWLVGFNSTDQHWYIYAVGASFGGVEFAYQIKNPKTVTADTKTFCFSEAMETMFIISQDLVSAYSVYYSNKEEGEVAASFYWSKATGAKFPKPAPFACAVRDENGIVYVGSDSDTTQRLVNVQQDGSQIWAPTANKLNDPITAPPSVSIDGVTFLASIGCYYTVDGNGLSSKIATFSNIAYGAFVIDDTSDFASYDGESFIPKLIDPKALGYSDGLQKDGYILHEELDMIVAFPADKGLLGRLFFHRSTTDSLAGNFPRSWYPVYWTDFNYATALFPDMLFMLERRSSDISVRGVKV